MARGPGSSSPSSLSTPARNRPTDSLSNGGYLHEFFASTFENWQSEWLQLVFQAILLLGAKHLIFRVDAEDLERIEAKIEDVKDRLCLPTPPPS